MFTRQVSSQIILLVEHIKNKILSFIFQIAELGIVQMGRDLIDQLVPVLPVSREKKEIRHVNFSWYLLYYHLTFTQLT